MNHCINHYAAPAPEPIVEMWRWLLDAAEREANKVQGITIERDKLRACDTNGWCTWLVSFGDEPRDLARALRAMADAIDRELA